MTRDRQAETKPTMLSRRRAVGLSKSIEDVREKLFADALTGIRNTDLNSWSSQSHFHANAPAAAE